MLRVFVDVEVLGLLNGSLRDVRTLQKIGEKKARLIYDWRALNGPLFSVSLTLIGCASFPHS